MSRPAIRPTPIFLLPIDKTPPPSYLAFLSRTELNGKPAFVALKIPQSTHRPPRWEVDTRCTYAITSICEKSRHGRSKLPDRDHPGVSGPCPHPHTAAQQHRGCGFVISFILRTILRARAELAPSPTPRLRRVVTRLHRGPRRWFLAVRSCRSPRRFDRAISRFI